MIELISSTSLQLRDLAHGYVSGGADASSDWEDTRNVRVHMMALSSMMDAIRIQSSVTDEMITTITSWLDSSSSLALSERQRVIAEIEVSSRRAEILYLSLTVIVLLLNLITVYSYISLRRRYKSIMSSSRLNEDSFTGIELEKTISATIAEIHPSAFPQPDRHSESSPFNSESADKDVDLEVLFGLSAVTFQPFSNTDWGNQHSPRGDDIVAMMPLDAIINHAIHLNGLDDVLVIIDLPLLVQAALVSDISILIKDALSLPFEISKGLQISNIRAEAIDNLNKARIVVSANGVFVQDEVNKIQDAFTNELADFQAGTPFTSRGMRLFADRIGALLNIDLVDNTLNITIETPLSSRDDDIYSPLGYSPADIRPPAASYDNDEHDESVNAVAPGVEDTDTNLSLPKSLVDDLYSILKSK